MNNEKDDFSYSNEAEEEMAQLHAIHLHMNAVSEVQRKIAKQAEQPSAEECQECGEEIPEARRQSVLGVQYCIFCQEYLERKGLA